MPAPLLTFLRHFWLDADDTHRVIDTSLMTQLMQQVAASELRHSGEIRICIEASLPLRALWHVSRHQSLAQTVRLRAVQLFSQLGVWDTANKNGVLIYVLLAEHAIEIVADRGLNAHVPAEQWSALVGRMGQSFRQGHYGQGLQDALQAITAKLVQHFAVQAVATKPDAVANPNELPDTPTRM